MSGRRRGWSEAREVHGVRRKAPVRSTEGEGPSTEWTDGGAGTPVWCR